ncbi:MAG: hypothetical protein FJZ86_18310 [Chloroflexi bacterium]|nr:hypothetical protein [Chloroflexota bacterium]
MKLLLKVIGATILVIFSFSLLLLPLNLLAWLAEKYLPTWLYLSMLCGVLFVLCIPFGLMFLEAAQHGVQPTAFGVGKRGHLENLLVSLGKYLVKIGGG